MDKLQLYRVKVENMILVGMWFGSGHPVMNTFMNPLKHSFKQLETAGTTYVHCLLRTFIL